MAVFCARIIFCGLAVVVNSLSVILSIIFCHSERIFCHSERSEESHCTHSAAADIRLIKPRDASHTFSMTIMCF